MKHCGENSVVTSEMHNLKDNSGSELLQSARDKQTVVFADAHIRCLTPNHRDVRRLVGAHWDALRVTEIVGREFRSVLDAYDSPTDPESVRTFQTPLAEVPAPGDGSSP